MQHKKVDMTIRYFHYPCVSWIDKPGGWNNSRGALFSNYKRPDLIRNSIPVKETILHYIRLTKPTIMLLVLFTGATSVILEGSLVHRPMLFALVLMGLYLTGGSANALNQYFERDIDARMTRTYKRRPLPLGKVSPVGALVFSIAIGAVGVAIFAIFFNWLTAVLSLGTILFYSLFYTLWLKPGTDQNIVIGGIAGAMAPVGAWTAATGRMDVIPWILFAIVFFWTPPHFWALALLCKDDYVKTDLPMMPVVRGDTATLRQIVIYTVVLFAVSLTLLAYGGGWFYLAVAACLGLIFIKRAVDAFRHRTRTAWRGLFSYSIIYLFGVFGGMIIDGLLR
ncbi:MAG: protoheme IX farnesyltransferase [Candidatus Zixiibacteriota bacterium]|nr:MAG: protoheme IX farnesyltransferase [candidate division Zixibacteria bacterium]